MPLMTYLFLTFAVGLFCGFILYKLKVPGGMMVGTIISVGVLNIIFDAAYMPYTAKLAAQITAGAYIGCTVEYKDVLEMRYLVLPIFILLAGYLVNCLITGRILHKRFGLSLQEGMLEPLQQVQAIWC